MKKMMTTLALFAATVFGCAAASSNALAEDVIIDGKAYRKLAVETYRDKMKAGWIGQIAGVCWGAPTEFRSCGVIMPEENVPKWRPEMINDAFGQDDLYVEMTFLHSMEVYGLDVSIRQAGIDFANSEYPLWHANVNGRKNLRMGIAPPNSGRPEFSHCADDIDYQIEADFSGLISPGLPNNAVHMGEKFGRLMNYGDGMYAGQFVGAMYAEAFFETDVTKIIETALKAIPAESGYAEMVRDVLGWKKEFPNDWQACWNKINEKYQLNPEYRKWDCGKPENAFNIDVKINGAYILVGLLYGEGDLDNTIIISTRCGQDSDCNPSSAAGVLFTTLGFKALPARFSEKLDEKAIFDHTAYNFPALIDVCDSLAKQAVEKEGGFMKEENGESFYYIPQTDVVPSALTSCADPTDKPEEGEAARFNEDELKQIKFRMYSDEEWLDKKFAGFRPVQMGTDMEPGVHDEYRGDKQVYVMHPVSVDEPGIIAKTCVPSKGDVLYMSVSCFENGNVAGDYILQVKANGDLLKEVVVSKDVLDSDGWLWIEVPLKKYVGQATVLEIVNKANDWKWEAAYFRTLGIDSPNSCEID